MHEGDEIEARSRESHRVDKAQAQQHAYTAGWNVCSLVKGAVSRKFSLLDQKQRNESSTYYSKGGDQYEAQRGLVTKVSVKHQWQR